MPNLRIVNTVGDRTAGISFVESENVSVFDNCNVIDFASQIPENSGDAFGSVRYVRVTLPSDDHPRPDFIQNEQLTTTDFIAGYRSVLSAGKSSGEALFYKYYIGRGPLLLVKSTASTAFNVVVNALTIQWTNPDTAGASTVEWASGSSTRKVVNLINEENNGLKAMVLYAGEASFATGTFSATTAGTKLYAPDYKLVYAPNASTSDLDEAKEVIRNQITVLADGEKSGLLDWDIEVEEYDSTTGGFLVALYTSKRNFNNFTFWVRYRAISTASGNTVTNNEVEVINPEPYMASGIHYTISEENGGYFLTDVSASHHQWGIGLFLKDTTTFNSSDVVSVDNNSLNFAGTAISFLDKTLEDVVAEINETIGSRVQATTLSKSSEILGRSAINEGDYTLRPEGTPLPVNRDLTVRISPNSRIAPLLPYDKETTSPWYPRISAGTFSSKQLLDESAYGSSWGTSYGSGEVETYHYSIPEYTRQTFSSDPGEPYRHVTHEKPYIIDQTILQTRRAPLEALNTIILRDGPTDISSQISDVDLDQGYIYLSAARDSYNDINVQYRYKEKSYVYNSIDLNPVDNGYLINKFVGIYLTPQRIGNNLYTSDSCVHHLIGDSIDEIQSALSGLTFSDESTLVHPVLVGVYQVVGTSDTDDVVVTKVPVLGGGLKESVLPEEEATWNWDISSWDGVPFEHHGTTIVEVPKSIVYTSDNQIRGIDPSSNFFTVGVSDNRIFMNPSMKFSERDIRSIADRWVALGNLAIVDLDPDA